VGGVRLDRRRHRRAVGRADDSRLAGPLALYFGGGYAIGTAISWFIQTYAPELQRAIGDLIGATIADISLAISIEAELQQQINAIDEMGSPGLNDVDFDGLQLGAVTTSDLLPF
jgi:hypothetical protein